MAAAPLHSESISQRCIPNRIFTIIYLCALSALFYRHFCTLSAATTVGTVVLRLIHLTSDFILALIWVTAQSFRVRPMLHRREFIETLKDRVEAVEYPPLDIFICTADPYKEPPISVVNTALSLLAYDYPPDKTSVYLSDDGASPLTLFAFFQAAIFATHWLPFCTLHQPSVRSPEAFFASPNHHLRCSDSNDIKMMYEKMKEKIEEVMALGRIPDKYINTNEERACFNKWTNTKAFARNNHPSIVKVLLERGKDVDCKGNSMPNLVYMSREKNPNVPHHFKGGALNAMLRVSATMTNAPLVLTMDCDMLSNDPQTPLRALCYFLDTKLSPTLSYVQFPQIFDGLNQNDIYAGEYKRLFKINPTGMDGFDGPNYVGTGAFFQRRSLFGTPSSPVLPRIPQLRPDYVPHLPISSPKTIDLAHVVAGCSSEEEEEGGWGSEMGFRYGSLVEDYYTGYRLHCQGWKSVFCCPERPAFIGEMPTNLIDMIGQCKRWAIGLNQTLFSKYSVFTFGFASSMHPITALSYSHYACWCLWSIPITFYTTIPQLALIHPRLGLRLDLFPRPWFPLYLFLCAGAFGQDMAEFVADGGSVGRWWSGQRMWVFKGVTSFLMGMLECILSALGLPANSFNVTSKVVGEEERRRYEEGVMEFGVASPMFVSLCSVAFLSLVAVVKEVVVVGCPRVSVEIMVAVGVVLSCIPVYEAALVRTDKGKIPLRVTVASALVVFCVVYCVDVMVKS